MWTNFINPFTAAFETELQKKVLHNLPPHLKSVAANLNAELQPTTFHSIQKCTKSFIFSKHLQRCHEVFAHVSTPINWEYYVFKISDISTHACFELSRARHLSMDASTARCSMLSQAFSKRCRNLLRWCTDKRRQQHSEKTTKLK